MAKCSKYHAKCKVTMPKCSKYHAKWHVLVPNCCKYKANGTRKESQKKIQNLRQKIPRNYSTPKKLSRSNCKLSCTTHTAGDVLGMPRGALCATLCTLCCFICSHTTLLIFRYLRPVLTVPLAQNQLCSITLSNGLHESAESRGHDSCYEGSPHHVLW